MFFKTLMIFWEEKDSVPEAKSRFPEAESRFTTSSLHYITDFNTVGYRVSCVPIHSFILIPLMPQCHKQSAKQGDRHFRALTFSIVPAGFVPCGLPLTSLRQTGHFFECCNTLLRMHSGWNVWLHMVRDAAEPLTSSRQMQYSESVVPGGRSTQILAWPGASIQFNPSMIIYM
jgi:hypothetical protein